MRIRIRGGRVVDPASGLDATQDVYAAEGRIVAVGNRPEGFHAEREIDATGLVVCPGLVDLAARLHPTPAVGGVPTHAALEWLTAHGETARGWYTGSVGWLTPEGDGEFAVVLRCAMLHGNRADLFAGAGIVAGSSPASEFDETELKFQALLDALTEA